MDNVKIKKAKIKDDLFLEVDYTENLAGHSKKTIGMSCTVPIHQDLKDAFAKLPVHLAVLVDGLELPSKVKEISQWAPEELKNFSVVSFSIGGNDDNEGITLTGSKTGTFGTVNFNSPFQKWENSEYRFINELHEKIEACLYEVEQYLFHGKKAPEPQLSLFNEEEEQGEEE